MACRGSVGAVMTFVGVNNVTGKDIIRRIVAEKHAHPAGDFEGKECRNSTSNMYRTKRRPIKLFVDEPYHLNV
jgi:hypothetical protein